MSVHDQLMSRIYLLTVLAFATGVSSCFTVLQLSGMCL